MPGVSQALFVARMLDRGLVQGRRVLDVGACDFNGSVRPLLEEWGAKEYIGIDIIAGPRVDIVCSADKLVNTFGEESFDVVLCIEMLEHAEDWRACVCNLKQVLKTDGLLILTTRSFGYPCHGFPHDYWRYELEDLRHIFRDLEIQVLESDYANPGVFLKGRKPENFRAKDLNEIELYSVLSNRREREIDQHIRSHAYYRRLALKQRVRLLAGNGFLAAGRLISRLLNV